MKQKMKQKNVLSLLIVAIILSSCSIQKRHYMSGYNVEFGKLRQTESSKNRIESSINSISEENLDSPINTDENTVASIENIKESELAAKRSYILPKNKKKLKFTYNNNECDEIILKDGQIIKGKVIELSDTEIKYKKCDNLEGPTISTNKKNVFMVRYANGTVDVINAISNNSSEQTKSSDGKKTEPLAIASVVSLGVALLASILIATDIAFLGLGLAVLLSLLAIIFGIIALVKIRKNKDSLKGKSLVWIGIIGGALFLFLTIGLFFIFE